MLMRLGGMLVSLVGVFLGALIVFAEMFRGQTMRLGRMVMLFGRLGMM